MKLKPGIEFDNDIIRRVHEKFPHLTEKQIRVAFFATFEYVKKKMKEPMAFGFTATRELGTMYLKTGKYLFQEEKYRRHLEKFDISQRKKRKIKEMAYKNRIFDVLLQDRIRAGHTFFNYHFMPSILGSFSVTKQYTRKELEENQNDSDND